MKLRWIIGVIIVSFIVLGFVIRVFPPLVGCTAMGCPCGNISGERPCNSCSFSEPIFTTGILNIMQQCKTQEIITCEDGVQVDSRIDLENKQCRTECYLFWFKIRNIGKSSEEETIISSKNNIHS